MPYTPPPRPPGLAPKALKAKQRAVREKFDDALMLRSHRAISWLTRSDGEKDDDVRFILLWIGFNSAYSCDPADPSPTQREAFNRFFETLVKLDQGNRIYSAVWVRFSQEIRVFLDNKYVYSPFWKLT